MPSPFAVGVKIRTPFGATKVSGEIVEDRGFLGVRGRRILRVLIPMEPEEPISFEVPEEELELDDSVENPIDTEAAIFYLKNAGLTSILRANTADVRDQPRCWLCWDQLGHLTHTFVEKRGQLGGATVPFRAVDGMRIFRPKKAEVTAFLRTFGLDQQQVEDVVASVGTYPR